MIHRLRKWIKSHAGVLRSQFQNQKANHSLFHGTDISCGCEEGEDYPIALKAIREMVVGEPTCTKHLLQL